MTFVSFVFIQVFFLTVNKLINVCRTVCLNCEDRICETMKTFSLAVLACCFIGLYAQGYQKYHFDKFLAKNTIILFLFSKINNCKTFVSKINYCNNCNNFTIYFTVIGVIYNKTPAKHRDIFRLLRNRQLSYSYFGRGNRI